MATTQAVGKKIDGIDRNLGEEWTKWEGRIEDNIEEGRLLFIKLTVVGLLLIISGILFHWYMITPRLEEFGPFLADIFFWGILLSISIVGIWISAMIISALTEKNFFLFCGKQNMTIMLNVLLPITLKIGQKMGYSKDRLGNSFVKVNNSLTMAMGERGDGKLLVILPRCLRQDIKDRFMEKAKTYNLDFFTASGGKAALRIIEEKRPSAIIGIACERDLINGIREVAPKIPVIGISNKRPEGPCKNTIIDFNRLERAIRFFKGRE